MKSLTPGSRAITEINVTPLVDIILVVLIIFMATAPLMDRKAVRVDVPAAKHTERAGLEALEVTFDTTRELRLAGKALSRETLVRALKERLGGDPELRVILSADRALPYGEIVGVLDLLRGTGLRKISLEVKGGL
ncbi:MAG: biopolymer transporter ExbD [Elusimicrobia bacterium]|nr:biopolymer transporter ExbD [Elusimicrobiota bacterium]